MLVAWLLCRPHGFAGRTCCAVFRAAMMAAGLLCWAHYGFAGFIAVWQPGAWASAGQVLVNARQGSVEVVEAGLDGGAAGRTGT